ncbi:dihydrolipoamide acetyltransferase family protein [Streptomyces sp. SUK 48]|uniref:dihydrolipoamide acetyltransferase family protein n=1 Tax=unclassified Streptomyces TaxID=2593676 RepID=UPI00129B8A01|nr:dihydrolipoamide acetyltransferase family protein [Streptomyces sp. SUK 48]
MAQVLEFKLPDLGEGLTEAEIVRWLVQVGDVVAVDQPVVEVETAKASVEVPCPYGGVVTARYGDEGTELPVGAPLLTVAVGEPDAESTAGSGNVLVGYGTSEAPGRRRRVRPVALTGGGAGGNGATGGSFAVDGAQAAGSGVDGAQAAAGSGVNGTAAAPASSLPATALLSDGPVPVISPLVRRLAREGGLDLRRLAGSGPEGLILRADVERALRTGADRESGRTAEVPVPAAFVRAAASASASGEVRVPLKGIRGAVADKLSRSRREIPDATCWVDADATELMRARTAMNAASGAKISLVALLARICTAALARFPELNSSVDTEAREIVQHPYVHLGFAAQTERGLVVPVVRDAHTRAAESLTAEFARLTEAARAGTLTPGELTGGTFTLNNYGVFGVDGSTPIVNHPEAAMLGVGRIVPKPWVHEGELAVRQVVQLSLTFDHRVCDGGTAGGFLRYVADCVEQPAVLLRTL